MPQEIPLLSLQPSLLPQTEQAEEVLLSFQPTSLKQDGKIGTTGEVTVPEETKVPMHMKAISPSGYETIPDHLS